MTSPDSQGRLPARRVGTKRVKQKSGEAASKEATKPKHPQTGAQSKKTGKRHKGTGLSVRCPIRAQFPDRYRKVQRHCTEYQSFSGSGPLNEHLRRYHSWSYWCTICKKNFATASQNDIRGIKERHICNAKEWLVMEELASHTWMTEEQEKSWQCWNKVEIESQSGETKENLQTRNWKKIHRALYPQIEEFPDPYHKVCTHELETCASSTTPNNGKAFSSVKSNAKRDRPSSGKRKATSERDIDRVPSSGCNSGGEQEGTDQGTVGPTESEYTAPQSAELLKEGNTLDDIELEGITDTVSRQQNHSHMTEIPNPELLWPNGVWPSEHAVAFSNPFSGDFTLAQHEQREAIQNLIDWNEDNEGPGSMVHSHTSDGTELYPALHASNSLLLDDLELWGKELEYDDTDGDWEDLLF